LSFALCVALVSASGDFPNLKLNVLAEVQA
jgi:hypothetical protein